jgi:hypothetical protein
MKYVIKDAGNDIRVFYPNKTSIGYTIKEFEKLVESNPDTLNRCVIQKITKKGEEYLINHPNIYLQAMAKQDAWVSRRKGTAPPTASTGVFQSRGSSPHVGRSGVFRRQRHFYGPQHQLIPLPFWWWGRLGNPVNIIYERGYPEYVVEREGGKQVAVTWTCEEEIQRHNKLHSVSNVFIALACLLFIGTPLIEMLIYSGNIYIEDFVTAVVIGVIFCVVAAIYRIRAGSIRKDCHQEREYA